MIARNECFSEGRLRVWCTTRHGGVSEPPFDTMNLGDHVGDDPNKVARNRSLIERQFDLPGDVNWLVQTMALRSSPMIVGREEGLPIVRKLAMLRSPAKVRSFLVSSLQTAFQLFFTLRPIIRSLRCT